MKLAITFALSAGIAASSVGCVLESVQIGHEDPGAGAGAGAGAAKDVGKDVDMCPFGARPCVADSVVSTACGDGIVQPEAGESCDDGGTVGGDGCSSLC